MDSPAVAHLKRYKRSPFWYLRRRDLDSGKWVEASTGLRADSPDDTRKAQRLADKATSEEQQLRAVTHNPAFAAWVPSYLATHWLNKGKESRRRYGTAWQALRAFLNAEGIIYPRQVRYAHGEAYIRWRQATPIHGKRTAGHNTALLEIKFLSQLLNEAVRRDFCESNPLLRLGIARAPEKIKPELTDKQIEHLRKQLVHQPEWMRIAFEIALYTGCRFSEAEIPLENIDFDRGTMRIRDAKRSESDPRKFFTVPIHERLRGTLERLRDKGETVTCRLSRDKNGRINWFFRKEGVEASFHSLRVTFVTRCHRAGLTQTESMKLVNHSSQLVHRIYSRLNVEDVRSAQARIPLP